MKYSLFKFSKSLLKIILLIYTINVKAQNQLDTVILKNGSKYLGRVVAKNTGINRYPDLHLQTTDNNIHVFKIKKIRRISSFNDSLDNYRKAFKPSVRKGYYNVSCIGLNNFKSWSFKTVNGYQFNNWTFLGLGVGLENFQVEENDHSLLILPIFADLRFEILKSDITPIVFGNIGYSFLSGDKSFNSLIHPNTINTFSNPGAYSALGIGVKSYLSKRIGILLETGIKFQKVDKTQNTSYYWWFFDTEEYYSHTSKIRTSYPNFFLNIGISF